MRHEAATYLGFGMVGAGVWLCPAAGLIVAGLVLVYAGIRGASGVRA